MIRSQMPDDVADVEHEHLVGELDVPHAVLVHEQIDFLDDALRAPEAVGIHSFLQPQLLLAGLERRLDAAERALVRAARASCRWPRTARDPRCPKQCQLWARYLFIGSRSQATPGHVVFEILDERRRRRSNGTGGALPPSQYASPRILSSVVALPGGLEQVDDRVQPFVVGDEVTRFVGERALGERRHVPAEHQDPCVGNRSTNGRAGQARPGHVLRRRGRLMAVDDDRHEPRADLGSTRSAICEGQARRPPHRRSGRCSLAAGRTWRSSPAQIGFSTAVRRLPSDW